MTDERMGEALFDAIARVPAGGGVLFRHDAFPDRAALGAEVAVAARRRGLRVAVAGDVALAEALGADMVHRPSGPTRLPISLPVHDADEAIAANARGAALVYVSPVFATSSHPGATALGIDRAERLARRCAAPRIALGGMNAQSFERLDRKVFAGWAGIDAFLAPETTR